jgi:hypothetical protein
VSALARASVMALTLGVVAMAVTPSSADPDLWGHLRFGLDLLDTGHVIRPDPYSFMTAGVPWVNHEWLAELLFALAWRAAGGPGLMLLKLLVGVGTFTLVLRYLHWRGLGALAASIVLLQAIPLTLPWIAVIRPQIFTYLGFVITLIAIARAEQGAPRMLWVLPPVFALWANLHGGVIAGLGILGLWLFARSVARVAAAWTWWQERRREGAIFMAVSPLALRELWEWPPALVAMAATLCNPYAGKMWLFFKTALVSRLEISEWNPIEIMGLEGFAHLLLLAPIVCGWFWSRREKRPALLFLFLWIAILPIVARRNTPLFALGLIILGGEHLADAVSRWFRIERELPLPAWMAAICLAGAAGGDVVAASDRRVTFSRVDYPVEAVTLLRDSGVRANLAIPMNWGEYALWHLGPSIQVSMDGRRETVYTDAGYLEVMDFTFGRDDWDRLLRRPGVDLALVPTAEWPVYNLMKLKPGWTPLFVDDRAALFGRDGSPAAARIAGRPRPPKEGKLLTFP